MSLSLLITMSTGFADKQTLSATNDIIENITLPDIIEEDEAIENKYVGRLAAMEQDLSTFVFANEDGTQTLRMFSHPVKYVDEKGETKDITLDIASTENGGFKTKDNSIITTFEKKLADGISLEYDDIDITMKPKLTSALSVASSNGKTVTYPYGLNTKIEYSLTYTGFKEDIVVEEYTGQTEYEFTLYTNGLKVEKIGEGYKITDDKGNIKANIGDIIIFTADERNNTFGELTCETVKANEEYLLTIHIEADYLSDPNTAYPIRIDPTIEINYTDSGSSAIQDVTINSNAGSDGSSSSLMVGNRETYGISRILMKFPGLSAYQGMDSDQIIKATVELRDVMCETQGMTIYCYPFTGNTWNESTASWSNVNPNSYGARLSSSVISYATGDALPVKHRYSFDITAAVETWTEDTTAFSKGIIFKASSDFESSGTYKHKTFASYERSSNQPSIRIVYEGSVAISKTIDYVMVGKTKAISYTTTPSGLTLTWTSSDTSIATVNSSGVVTGIKPGVVDITASHYDSSTGMTYSGSMSMHVMSSVGIQDDTNYYIMNCNSLRLMSLETESDASGTNVSTRARSSSALSQWITEKQTDGSFQLISEYSPTGKVLNVSGTNIDISTDSNASTSKFEICRVASPNYKGLYVIIYGSYFVAQDSNYNVYLTPAISQNILWSFMAVEKGDASVFSFNYVGYNTSAEDEMFCTVMQGEGFTSWSFTNSTATNAYEYLTQYDDIFIFNGHGGAGHIGFRDASGASTGAIAVNASVASHFQIGNDKQYIENCPDNSLAQLRIVLYLGCNTGNYINANGQTYNLVDATYEKGAHFVLGTQKSLYSSDHVAWTEYFLDALDFGYSVGEAILAATESLGSIFVPNEGTEDPNDDMLLKEIPVYYVGDLTQYIETDW